jgi:hypothetical protein
MNRALLWKAECARIVTSCTWWYIQVCTGLCRFIAVPYYSMVCMAMELCCHYHNWVHTISCHVLKIKVKSLNSTYWDKSGPYQYVLRQTWNMQFPEQYVLRQTWDSTRFAWYILVCTETNLLHADMYAKKKNWKLCMMSRFEPRTSCILSCMLYCYATSVNSLVIGMDRTRYIINKKDICNILAGVGRPGRVPRRNPLRPWRHWSGHQLELGFPGNPGWMRSRTEIGSCHMAQDLRLTEIGHCPWLARSDSESVSLRLRPCTARWRTAVHQYSSPVFANLS